MGSVVYSGCGFFYVSRVISKSIEVDLNY
jgi:hypothetical protein